MVLLRFRFLGDGHELFAILFDNIRYHILVIKSEIPFSCICLLFSFFFLFVFLLPSYSVRWLSIEPAWACRCSECCVFFFFSCLSPVVELNTGQHLFYIFGRKLRMILTMNATIASFLLSAFINFHCIAVGFVLVCFWNALLFLLCLPDPNNLMVLLLNELEFCWMVMLLHLLCLKIVQTLQKKFLWKCLIT